MADVDRDCGDEFPHLHKTARAVLQESKERRIEFVFRDRWIDYPAARLAIGKVMDLMPKPVTVRSRGILLSARPDNGKSSLLAHLAKLHRPRVTEDGETRWDFVRMSMPEEPREEKFWAAMLKALSIEFSARHPAKVLRARAEEVLGAIKPRILAVDDVHNMLHGSGKQQSLAIATLKTLAEELRLHLVVAGTEAAVNAVATDAQVGTRFGLVILPIWRETETLRSFLAGLESTLPLPEPSDLAGKPMVQALRARAHDTIGGYVWIAQLATELAIKRDHKRLTPALIEAVDWRPVAHLPQGVPLDI